VGANYPILNDGKLTGWPKLQAVLTCLTMLKFFRYCIPFYLTVAVGQLNAQPYSVHQGYQLILTERKLDKPTEQVLLAFEQLWLNSGDRTFYNFLVANIDTSKASPLLINLYKTTSEQKYLSANDQEATAAFLLARFDLYQNDAGFDSIMQMVIKGCEKTSAASMPAELAEIAAVTNYLPVNSAAYNQLKEAMRPLINTNLFNQCAALLKTKGYEQAGLHFYYSLLNLYRKGYISDQQMASIGKLNQVYLNNFKSRTNLITTQYFGQYLLAQIEYELNTQITIGRHKTVVLDRFYNAEKKPGAGGKPDYWHYSFNDRTNGGFYVLGHIFENFGAAITQLNDAPTPAKLHQASVYIIVDADNTKENPKPNEVTDSAVTAIKNWVHNGGVLLLMANDSANCQLSAMNAIANQFKINFKCNSLNPVLNNQYTMGIVRPQKSQTVFKKAEKFYLKELSSLQIGTAAVPLANIDNETVMAYTRYGKGMVFAVGDPWLYNEYTDGKILSADFQNHLAATELVNWLLSTTTAH
jgi:hypothetical protein